DVVPRALGALGRAHEVVDVVVVDLGEERGAPGGLLAREEVVERLEPEVAHPLRLGLELGDLGDDLGVDALGRLVQVVLGVVEAEALGVVGVDVLKLGGAHHSTSSLTVSLSTCTGKVSTGSYAGRVLGFPVRRSNSEP